MSRRVLLVTIGADALPATTPVVPVAATWVPAVYVPPSPSAPTGLAAASRADAVLLTYGASDATDPEYAIERAPDVSGAPGAWSELARTPDLIYSDPVDDESLRWYRVRAFNRRGTPSAYSNSVAERGTSLATLTDEIENAQDTADAAEGAAASANAKLTIISDDGWLSAGEKPSTMRQHQILSGEVGGIQASADSFGVSRPAHDDALNALNVYLGGLSPAWNDTTTDTEIVSATFNGKFADYYAARQALLDAIAAKAKQLADGALDAANDAHAAADNAQSTADAADTAAADANNAIGVITSDAWLSRAEKPAVMREHQAISAMLSGIQASATAFGVSQTAHNDAKSALDTYLGGLAPAWNDTSSDTEIVGSTFNNKFSDYYAARQALLDAIADKAKEIADTAVDGLTGSGNLLTNSELVGTRGWVRGGNPVTSWGVMDGEASSFIPDRMRSLRTNWATAVDGHYSDSRAGDTRVEGGKRYVFSAYFSLIRCDGSIYFRGYDTNGAFVSHAVKHFSADNGSKSLADLPRHFAVFDAPTDVVKMQAWVRAWHIVGQDNAFFDIVRPMIEQVGPAQSKPSAWVPSAIDNDERVQPPIEISDNDGVDDSGIRRLGLRIPGSGHKPGDQRNSWATTIGSVRSRWDGLTISYTVPSTGDPATVTISATAATLRAGSASINYSSASVDVSQARDTTVTYQLYYIDADYAGGARTLNATTNANNLADRDDVVWVGSVTVEVPAEGTSGGGDGDLGGGCVDLAMWLDASMRAGDAKVGDEIDCAVYGEPASIERRPIMACPVTVQPCHRIVSASGAAVIASDSTPMTLRDGRTAYLPDMLGADVLVDDDAGLRWEPCVACYPVGNRPVVKVNVSDTCYFAGESPRARIATHNSTVKP